MAIAPGVSWLLFSLPLVMSAQVLITPSGSVPVAHSFAISPDAAPLNCHVTPTPPELDFALRFHSGYVIDLPLSQFRGANHRARIFLNVTPAGGSPAHLVSRIFFPDMPVTELYGEIKGDFIVGEGTYKVGAYVVDDLHRVCRAQWQIRARRKAGERRVDLAIPPLSVAAESMPPSAAQVTGSRQLPRLTVLLHAASVDPDAGKLRKSDISILTGSLSSLLRQLPAKTVSLVIFNLDQQAVLFRKEGFTESGLEGVTEVLKQEQLSLVNYAVLRQSRGGVALLASLTMDALRDSAGGGTLVFLGPHVRFQDPVPSGFGNRSHCLSRTFYLQYRPPMTLARVGAEPAVSNSVYNADPLVYLSPSDEEVLTPRDAPDSIEQVVKSLKGEVMVMRRPSDLAGAIEHIRSRSPQ